jgi:predicted nucleic acid-binding protein
MSFLLDTCAISELIKATPNSGFLEWMRWQEEHHVFLSVISIGEITKGITKLSDDFRKETLQHWVHHDLISRFQDRLLPINSDVSQKWGELLGYAELRGQKLPAIDALLAATAFVYELTIVTRNISDLERFSIPILNPWSSQK